MVDTVTAQKVIFILGITNIIFAVLIFFSCRCMLEIFVGKLMKYGWYSKFYKYHCYYWRFFILSVIVHATLAFLTFGNPF